MEIKRIINNLKSDYTLEQLEEKGKINIDFIDEDLDLFIKALEELTGKEYLVYSDIGGQYLREVVPGRVTFN